MKIETKFDLFQTVMIVDIKSPAIIDKIVILAPGIIQYSVSYWLNGEQKTALTYEKELSY